LTLIPALAASVMFASTKLSGSYERIRVGNRWASRRCMVYLSGLDGDIMSYVPRNDGLVLAEQG
jgi:hypothetical protein